MNIDSLRRSLKERTRLETGFSMLEAVVVVGVLLALAIGGFIAYGSITENAKIAKVKAAASDVYTAAMAKSFDGDSETDPQDAIDEFNKSQTIIKVKLGDIYSDDETVVVPVPGEDFCVGAKNLENPEIKASFGKCYDGSGGSGGGDGSNNLPGIAQCHPLVIDYLKATYARGSYRSPEIVLIDAKKSIDPEAETKAYNEILMPLEGKKTAAENALIASSEAINNYMGIYELMQNDQGFIESNDRFMAAALAYAAENVNITDYQFNDPAKVQKLYDDWVKAGSDQLEYLCGS